MESEKINIYASKEVACALLSRVYLYMGKWQEAKDYADLVIESGRYTLLEGESYQKYPTFVPEKNSETIWAIRMMKDVDFKKYHMASYSVGSMYARINETGWGEMYPSSTYLELIDQHPTDLRHAFIVPQELSPAKKWINYTKPQGDSYVNVMNEVELQADGTYLITERPEEYTSKVVQQELHNGKVRYYVVRNDDNSKYFVKIENATKTRNGYPMRYIYKCSLQEEQSHL